MRPDSTAGKSESLHLEMGNRARLYGQARVPRLTVALRD